MDGRERAEALAIGAGGVLLELPCDPRFPAWGVTIPPAGIGAVVRQHPGFVRVAIGKRAWAVMSDQPLPDAIAIEAKRWAKLHPDATTIADAATALVAALDHAFEFSWVISIPGGQHTPTEMWIQPSTGEARASVGVHMDGIHVGDEIVALPKARKLADACARVVIHVRAQLENFAKNVALTDECARVAGELAKTLGKSARATGAPCPTHASPVAMVIFDGEREVARVEARDGGVRVDAGLPGDLGWHGTAENASASLEAIARAIASMARVVTLDALEVGKRYRVLVSFSGLRENDIVEYGGPIDNHAPHSFHGAASGEVVIDETALRENAHRVLTRT